MKINREESVMYSEINQTAFVFLGAELFLHEHFLYSICACEYILFIINLYK